MYERTKKITKKFLVAGLIKATHGVYADAIRRGIADNEIPDEMSRRLDHDAFMFSGFKVHHELSEAGLSLRDGSGKVKGYETFANDVRKIHDTYNGAYLRAEYNFAIASAQMAAKWQDVKGGGDSYNLQYRTAGDNRVREEHAALNGTTLPANDPFWRSYYPPNGWMCRCNVVEVRKEKFPKSDSKEAIRKGDMATDKRDRFGNNKGAIFRFNPGAQERIFPEKHPYFPKGCGDCEYKSNLAYRRKRQECQVCENINDVYGHIERKDINAAMKNLENCSGAILKQQVAAIMQMKIFKPLDGHKNVYIHATGCKDSDLENLKKAAKKAIEYGFKEVYILPNIKEITTADFIFARPGFCAVYELKTPTKEGSIDSRLKKGATQADRLAFSIETKCNYRKLGKKIKHHFDSHNTAKEVIILKKGCRKKPITRDWVEIAGNDFPEQLAKEYGR